MPGGRCAVRIRENREPAAARAGTYGGNNWINRKEWAERGSWGRAGLSETEYRNRAKWRACVFDREKAKETFHAYTASFDLQEDRILSKVKHTMRVACFCERIAESLHMNRQEVDFCWYLGLLHDIGRFEQVKRFGTFLDSASVDHAEFGADLLFREGLIASFPQAGLPSGWREMAETAIRQHNKLRIQEGVSERLLCFCQVLRDADKTDIFRVVDELPFEKRIGSSIGLFTDAEEASPGVMACVFEHRCVPREIRHTRFEGHLSHVCMAFELVYPESRRIVQEQGFLGRLLSIHDESGEACWKEKECQQLKAARTEIEKAWGCRIERK